MNDREFDRAGERAEESRQAAVSAHQRAMDPLRDKTVADSAETCAICEDPIPQPRREAWPGVQTCVDCKNELENAVKGGGY
jgi:phage/conjugal plasmid C-4 type zinc finger TraR family protein